jgi:hypothetical protein
LAVPTIGIFCASDPALTGLYEGARAQLWARQARPRNRLR